MKETSKKTTRSASMRDVAQAARVSTATVSKVLNNGAGVAEKTRASVLEICEKLGYKLNPSIQDLLKNGATGFSSNIAFVLVECGFSNTAYSSLTEGVSLAVEKNNLHLILARLTGEEKSFYELPPVLRDGRVGGIVMSGAITENVIAVLDATGIPYLIIGNYADSVSSDASCVELDIDRMLLGIADRLKAAGSERTAFFLVSEDKYFSRQSFSAYTMALEKTGLLFDEKLIYKGCEGPYAAFNLMDTVLTGDKPPFDTIVCLNFQAAQEIAFMLLARYGKETAASVIIGTTGISNERLPLSGVYAEDMIPEMALTGIEMLLEIMKDENTPKRRLLLAPRVIYEK